MTPDLTADSSGEASNQVPSTAGMTTKVVKGSMWTLGGSVLPLAVSFISTPFIIRFLGTESYGVLLLVGLIPTYFAFADFGMGIASTKFASEAYGQGDEKKEAEIVWTATAIAAVSAVIVAVPIFLFSYPIVASLNVPEHLLSQASISLKITSGSFFLGILSSVLNSPMLARLRMDLNMLTSAVPKILLAVGTPFILYFGGGIVEAVSWAFIVGIGILAVVVYFSGRLLPRLATITFNRELLGPLIQFGGALGISGIAAVLLVNLEKLILVRVTSVEALAYYGVASTLAGMAIMFGTSIQQALVPAFSQLLEPNKDEELKLLNSRTTRMNILGIAPLFAALFVIAGPFFTVWAGPEFGRESTTPFHIMIIALFFNLYSYVPVSLIMARGRTDVFAKVYWIELFPYIALTGFLTAIYGAVGAALGWSIRVLFDTCIMTYVGSRISGVSISVFTGQWLRLGVALLVLIPPAVIAALSDEVLNWSLAILPICLFAYVILVWNTLFQSDERAWAKLKLHGLLADLLK